MLDITGYSDKVSVRPGGSVDFMINCRAATYRADIVRLICGDTSPDGPGFKEEVIPSPVGKRYKGRRQIIHAGSYVSLASRPLIERLESFTVQAMIWPTTPEKGAQALLSKWSAKKGGFIFGIDEAGSITLTLGDGSGKTVSRSVGKPMLARHWYLVAASWDAASKTISLYQVAQKTYAHATDSGSAASKVRFGVLGNNDAPLLMAATAGAKNPRAMAQLYNGKIDSPRLANRALERAEIEALRAQVLPAPLVPALIAAWDFSRDIKGVRVSDASSNRLDGEIVNLPTRGMTGWNWTGEAMNWAAAPGQYGAIHFHDDDLYDAGWEVDFTFEVPDDLKSGIYAARVRAGKEEEYVPFAVRPIAGKENKIAFLLPTVHYMAYANEHLAFNGPIAELMTGQVSVMHPTHVFLNEHREYGCSLYDTHSDGSGVSYSSRLRPMLNMRPKYQTQWSCYGKADSNLREFNLDLYIIDWMEKFGFEYDVITDEDIHNEGLDVLRAHRVLITGGHPEYYSKAMRDAVFDFTQTGGRLMYMGGNGFYWRVAVHEELPGVIEVRRCEAAIKTWEAETGEYYHSFTGEYGGLWRHQGDSAPQAIAGVGFVAEGFDISSYYRRRPESNDPRVAFMFEGVEDEILGDFGYHGEGAAGNELDRAEVALGTPPHALVVASSENHTDLYVLVNEEVIVNHPGMTGSESDLVRADMTFYETPNGGAVFATGSICYCASLPWNDYDNNIARLTTNVLRRFADAKAF